MQGVRLDGHVEVLRDAEKVEVVPVDITTKDPTTIELTGQSVVPFRVSMPPEVRNYDRPPAFVLDLIHGEPAETFRLEPPARLSVCRLVRPAWESAQVASIFETDVRRVVDAVNELPIAEWPGGYPDSLGLCVLDAVFSVNTNYKRTLEPRINALRKSHPESDTWTASELVVAIDAAGGPAGFADVFGNRQLTSTRGGILKAAAVRSAALTLASLPEPIETALELRSVAERGALDAARAGWLKVHGQSSGITWRYVLMLAGVEGVKPDRMITGFIRKVLGRNVSASEAIELVTAVTPLLRDESSVRDVDHRIWSAQRGPRADRPVGTI